MTGREIIDAILQKAKDFDTGREIIKAILKGAEGLDSEIPCRIVFRDWAGEVVSEQFIVNYVIIDGEIIIDARRQ